MGRVFYILSLFPLILAACAKSPGFKAEEFKYEMVKATPEEAKTGPSGDETKPDIGSVVRDQNRIVFTPKKSDWDDEKLVVVADVKVDNESLGELEFKGKKENSKIFLTPTNPEYKNKVKAQVICTSEAGCEEFFIDVFYNDDGVLYHNQVLPTPKAPKRTGKNPAVPRDSKTAPNQNSGTPTDQKAKEPPKDKVNPGNTKNEGAKPGEQKKSGGNQAPPAIPQAPKEQPLEEVVIPDGVKEEDVKHEGFVGTSNDEALGQFQIENPKKSKSPVDQNKPGTGHPPSAPTAPSPSKDVPSKEGDQGSKSGQQDPQKNELAALLAFNAVDQVINRPNDGRLNKGSDFFKLSALPGAFFFIAKPNEKNYFGSFDLARFMYMAGKALNKLIPGKKLAITEISQFGGGPICFEKLIDGKWKTVCHESHQNGTDIDIRYLCQNEKQPCDVVEKDKSLNKDFLPAEQWKLLKAMFETNQVEIFFVHPVVKETMCAEARRANDYTHGNNTSFGAKLLKKLYATDDAHDDHLHVRVKCGPDQPRCRKIIYKDRPVGCT